MAIAFKPTCSLNAFALQYVNSQCQHDSLSLKLAAKLHLFIETSKFMTDYFVFRFSYILRIYFFQTHKRTSIMRSPNTFDFSTLIEFSHVSPSKTTSNFTFNRPPQKSVAMNSKKPASFTNGVTSKIRCLRFFINH